MKSNALFLSTLFLALYLQALPSYFYIAGAVGARTNTLTGILQISVLVLCLFFLLRIKECRQRLTHLGIEDGLFLGFFVIVFGDICISGFSYTLPKNLEIYFLVYSFSFFIARGLTLKQFRLLFYLTSAISILTSLVLFRDFIGGAAVSVNGARLVVGDTGNPIEAGNLGAYATLMSLLLSVKAKDIPTRLIFLALAYPGGMVAWLSGTRSAVLAVTFGGMFIIATLLIFKLKQFGARLKKFSVSSILYYTLILICLTVMPMMSAPNSAQSTSSSSMSGIDLQRTSNRLMSIPLLSDQAPDKSVGERYLLYDRAIAYFNKSPIFGNRVYSAGFSHNVFLQVLAEFGIFGLFTYVLPFFLVVVNYCRILLHSLKQPSYYFNSDTWTVVAFTGLLLIQALLAALVHADPYRAYFLPCTVGLVLGFSRLGLQPKFKPR